LKTAMAEPSTRPARQMRLPARLRDSNTHTALSGAAKAGRSGQQQPNNSSSRKRRAQTIQSHPLDVSDSDFEFDEDEMVSDGSGSESDGAPATGRGKAGSRNRRVKVVRTASGPAAVAPRVAR
jgi:hypothetical protein